MKLQLALDGPEHLGLLPQIAQYFDIIEVGTPLLKRFGVGTIPTVIEMAPGKEVLADTKTVDGAVFEADMMFGAGAKYMTAIAHSPAATREGALESAARFGADVIFDLILPGEPDLPTTTPGGAPMIVGLHQSFDERGAGRTRDHISRIAEWKRRGFRVSIAGGIGRANFEAVLAQDPDIAVIGSTVTAASNPVAEAAWLRQAVDANTLTV